MMQKEIIDRLCNLYDQYGNEIYADANKLKGFLADVLYDFPKERKRIGIILTEDILSKITDSAINTMRLQSISQNVSDIFSMESSVVSEIIFSFAYIIHRKEEYLNYADGDIADRMNAAIIAGDTDKAFKLAQIGAECGNDRCIGALGTMYKYGNGTPIDLEKSFALFSNCTRPRAYCELGLFYLDGDVVEKDINKAIELIEKSIQMGYSFAYTILGDIYTYDMKDYNKGFLYYRKAADAGIIQSYVQLGFCYYNGFGVEKDTVKAAEYFQKAIDNNDSVAISHKMLAIYYENVYPDKAIEHLQVAIKIFEEQNDKEQIICVDKLFRLLLNKYISLWLEHRVDEKTNNDMRDCTFKGAEFNISNIQGFLAEAYHDGTMFVEKDEEKELYWLTKSAENGWAESQYRLYVHYNSKGDLNTAISWLTKGVEQYHELSLGAFINMVLLSNELSNLIKPTLMYSMEFMNRNKDWPEPSKYPSLKLQMARLISKNRNEVKLLSPDWNDKLLDDMIQLYVTHAHESDFKSMTLQYFENINGIWRLK